jgi:hypothetical protein
MARLSRNVIVIVGVVALLALSACGGSSPSPSPSASPAPPIADLTELATHLGAQEAWWAAPTQTELAKLLGDSSSVSPSASASATTYAVLMRGDFNDASGKSMPWAVATGTVGGNLTATVFAARPEVSGHAWTVLDLPSPEASP